MCLVTKVVFTLFKGGEIHEGSELIGPAEPHADFLADSVSDCSSDGKYDFFFINKSFDKMIYVFSESVPECFGVFFF